MLGNAVVFGTEPKRIRVNPLPPPQVKSNLRNNCINGYGDFQEGNRLLDVYLMTRSKT